MYAYAIYMYIYTHDRSLYLCVYMHDSLVIANIFGFHSSIGISQLKPFARYNWWSRLPSTGFCISYIYIMYVYVICDM